MSGKRIFAILLLILLMASFVSNPSKKEIQLALRDRIVTVLKSELGIKHEDAYQLAMTLYGNKMMEELLSNYTEVQNWYFFSLVKVFWQGDSTVIGGGAFSKIWFSRQIDQKAKEIIDTLKKVR